LEEILSAIESSSTATADQKTSLLALFEDAVTFDRLDAETAVAMLDLVEWATLPTEEDVVQALDVLHGALTALVADEIVDPLAYITSQLNTALTPEGVPNAITNAGASDETLAAAQELIASSIPPGILVRVTKELLREGASEEEIAERLAILDASYADGASAGPAANEAVGYGSFQYEEQEEEQDAVQGEPEDPKEEQNANGARSDNTNNGKKPDKKK